MFYFHPNLGTDSHFDEHIFQMGWFDHQPVYVVCMLFILDDIADDIFSDGLKPPNLETYSVSNSFRSARGWEKNLGPGRSRCGNLWVLCSYPQPMFRGCAGDPGILLKNAGFTMNRLHQQNT